ncbi:hypothetical protein [Streptomyces sp. NPDC058252]|uniref:hypothetical protein n=1 Tax=Streptomyces sp. NPDC058252 TaxID=3346405 RepID=UPI0036EE33ED
MDAVPRYGDTGEQDVRALRQEFGEDVPTLPIFMDEGPHVRTKEDVPHEHALSDLWDDQELSDEDIEAALFEMVDSGELICGWIPERGEFGFWVPEPAQEPVREAPTAVRHRKPVSKVSQALRGSALATLAALSAAPVAMAGVAFTVNAHVKNPSVDVPDMAPEEFPDRDAVDKPEVADPQERPASTWHASVPTEEPRKMAPRHRSLIPAVEFQGQKVSYVGKHRKPYAAVPATYDQSGNRDQHGQHHDHHGQHQHTVSAVTLLDDTGKNGADLVESLFRC